VNASPPSRLIEAALEIQGFCEHRRWPFCFIGGIAVLHWGEARLTRDADLTIFTGIGREQYFIEEILTQFKSRIEDALTFALEHRVLLLHATNRIPVDLSLGALPFEESAVRDATMQEITPGVKLRLCAPAALVVYKVFAGRPQDWLDVEGIVVRRRREIDWAHVRQELGQLLHFKEDSESLPRLEALLTTYSSG
jgi:hypothetical protein